MTDLCPSCGYDLTPDRPIVRGHWRVLPDEARYCGIKVALTRQEARILYTLAKAAGNVTAEAVANRVSDSEDGPNLFRSKLYHIRQSIGPLCPIKSVGEHEYRWVEVEA